MATIVTGGQYAEILNFTLSSSDDVQVGFTKACNTILIKARTAADIQVRTSRNANHYFTIPSGTTLTLQMVGKIENGVVQPTNIWLRSASATPVAEVIGLYGS